MTIVIMLAMEYQVLLYYKYIEIKDPQAVMLWKKMLCDKLRLKGRIIIAHEGINGTVERLKKDTSTYMREMKEYESVKEIHYQHSNYNSTPIKRLSQYAQAACDAKKLQDICSKTVSKMSINSKTA